jgi:hypothetical protein
VSPGGTVDRARSRFQPSLRDLSADPVGQPKAEALGYCRASLRDEVKILLLCFLQLLCLAAARADSVSKEYQARAVMLWRFAQFVEWPSSAFPTTNSPLVIGVLGENPFGDALRLAVKGETAHGRPIEVQYFRRAEEATSCHVLYISQSEARHLKEIMAVLNHKSILTVSDIEGFARDHGGIIRFLSEQNRLAFRINIDAAKAANLVIDSRLLRLAEVATSR